MREVVRRTLLICSAGWGCCESKPTIILHFFAIQFNVSKVKLATLIIGEPKAPFSKATIPRCRGGFYTIPWISLL